LGWEIHLGKNSTRQKLIEKSTDQWISADQVRVTITAE
jgi:hypothetical protein